MQKLKGITFNVLKKGCSSIEKIMKVCGMIARRHNITMQNRKFDIAIVNMLLK